MVWLCIWDVYTSFAHNTLSCMFHVCVDRMPFSGISTCYTRLKERKAAGPPLAFSVSCETSQLGMAATSVFICLHKVRIIKKCKRRLDTKFNVILNQGTKSSSVKFLLQLYRKCSKCTLNESLSPRTDLGVLKEAKSCLPLPD